MKPVFVGVESSLAPIQYLPYPRRLPRLYCPQRQGYAGCNLTARSPVGDLVQLWWDMAKDELKPLAGNWSSSVIQCYSFYY